MRLYLVQHGKAKSRDEDPDRHLTDDGQKEVESMAAFLQPLNIKVQALWHSGKARAAQTADILVGGIKAKQGAMQHDGLSPNNDIAPIVEAILRLDQDIFIVGHLPFLGKLASRLLCHDKSADVIQFRYGGVVCLEQDEHAAWSVNWMVTPDLL